MKYFFILITSTLWLFGSNFTLQSESLKGQITKIQEFNGFGCSGANISPELHWNKPPKRTKSFAVTMYDPDAPTGSGWWHWIIVNIPANSRQLAQGVSDSQTLPKGIVEVINDFGTVGYGGACPPSRDDAHMYVITIYALDIAKLDITKTTNRAIAGYMINHHTLAKSTIISYYKR